MKIKLLLITTMKDLLEKEMGEIQCNHQMCNYSGMDSTRSSSWTGSNRKTPTLETTKKTNLQKDLTSTQPL